MENIIDELEKIKTINMRLSLMIGVAYGMLINLECYTDSENMEWLKKQIDEIFYNDNK